jgi:NAD(P)-dependent dehydrogenase (short-subunit alcohol dehydrogenase family)
VFDFAGQVALVSGAGAGIGLQIARAFHDVGAGVALGDIRTEALTRARGRLGAGAPVWTGPVDVRDPDAVAAWVAGAESALGPITVGVANAGIYPNTPVLELTADEWDRVMETNVRGVFLTCQAVARSMVARGQGGKIITLSSGAAISGRPGAAHYCASKAAVSMFTRVLALELAPHHINVNAIAPGLIQVEGEVSPISAEYVRAMIGLVPWGRIGQPADIANAALFLASPLADYLTGEVMAVDGGVSAGRAGLPLSRPAS